MLCCAFQARLINLTKLKIKFHGHSSLHSNKCLAHQRLKSSLAFRKKKIDIPLDVIIKRKRVPIDKDDHPPADEQSKTKAQNCIMIVGAAGTSLQLAILISLRILVIHCSLDVKVVCENFITTAHQHDDDAERSASKPYLHCVQFKLFFFLFHQQRKKQNYF